MNRRKFVRIEFSYTIVSHVYWNVGNLSFPYKKIALRAQKRLLGEDQDHNGHFNENILGKLACFLFTTQTSLSSNSHCRLNYFVIVTTNGY